MIHKHILVPDRVRRPPADGWSWIDRRFLREHAPRLSARGDRVVFLSGRGERQGRIVVLR